MSSIKTFENIYKTTYDDVLKYVIFKCSNLEDVNDIMQEVYIQFYHELLKREIDNPKGYIIGIAKNKMKRYYSFHTKIRNLFISRSVDDEALSSTLNSDFDLEEHVLNEMTKDEIWKYLIKKDVTTAKIFWLYYAEDIKLSEIAEELDIKESTVKARLYRTLKEISSIFGKE